MVYQLGEKLGSGSFGDVYKGVEVETGKEVAIKKFKKITEEELHEIEFLKNLKTECSEYIVCFEAFERSKDYLWLITEYIDYPTLTEYITMKQDASDSEKRDIMINISKAIQKIHNLHIIHKDIKPENILIDPKTHKVKIIDFGMACYVGENYCKLPSGTRLYADPILVENKIVTQKSDIYALGIIFILIEKWDINSIEISKQYDTYPFDIIKLVIKREINNQLKTIHDKNLVQLISNMTNNLPSVRPNITEVLHELKI